MSNVVMEETMVEEKKQNWLQRNWKKILAGAGLVAAGVAIGILATKDQDKQEDTVDKICDVLFPDKNGHECSYKDGVKGLITTPFDSSYVGYGDRQGPYKLSDLGKFGEDRISNGNDPDSIVTGLMVNTMDPENYGEKKES